MDVAAIEQRCRNNKTFTAYHKAI